MRKIYLLLVTALLASAALAQVPVTFSVDLRVKTLEMLFAPATDSVTVHGDFMVDAGLGSNWFPSGVRLSDPDHDTVYTVTVNMDSTRTDSTYHYKFTMNDVSWEGDPNRSFTLAKPSVVLPRVWFDRDSVVNITASNTLNFTADLTPYYGTGAGFFDPATDSLLLMGLDWTGATVIGGTRKFVEDPFQPGIYHAQMIIRGNVGDSTKWKTKAYPDARFANTGWEYTTDKWYHIQVNGTVADIPVFVPDIWPLHAATTQAVHVLFQVDMTNARNRYNSQVIDPTTLTFVGLKGQPGVLGAWVGDWTVSDTTVTPRNLLVLNDHGANGDKVAGDKVWSIEVTFPSGDAGGPYLYKYGAFYPGSDTVNNAFHAGDNEMLSGFDHYFVLADVPRIEIRNTFSVVQAVVTGVAGPEPDNGKPGEFSLSQNYPNPFNPSTTIRYTVPQSGAVSLKLFDVLGREVATLVNGNQDAGSFVVQLDARHLASGLYVYRLEAGSFTAVRKMMLMK